MKPSIPTRRLAAILILLTCILPANYALAGDSRLTVLTKNGAHAFRVEEALTQAQRERGLMGRKVLPPDHGMLFVFPATAPVSFWMKDTLIPLDMLFVRADGTIAGIVANAKPLSREIIPSPGPVRFVVELNGGRAAQIGAEAGDRVESPLIR